MSRGAVGLVPVGLGVAWLGYTCGIWGYCLVRGYNVTFTQCFKATWPGGKTPAAPAPAGGAPPDTRPGAGVGRANNPAPRVPTGRVGSGGVVPPSMPAP